MKEAPPLHPGPEDIVVQAEASLLEWRSFSREDESTYDRCGFVGLVVQKDKEKHYNQGQRVIGIGPLQSHIVLHYRSCLSFPWELPILWNAAFPLALVLLICFREISISPGERVLVVGADIRGIMAAQFARIAGSGWIGGSQGAKVELTGDKTIFWDQFLSLPNNSIPQGNFHVLLETSGEMEWFNQALPLVEERGRVILMSENYAAAESFDFYSHLHRRSLVLLTPGLLNPLHGLDFSKLWWPRDGNFLCFLFQSGRLKIDSLCQEIAVPASTETPWSIPIQNGGLLLRW
ncbi:MAG: hypothetical protein QME90_00825 [Thermodesulfobacteriota bacterium]|nr:hypothetical protein [Thermodesulfobacteriota bacterium]